MTVTNGPTSVLDRIPVEEIRQQARDVRTGDAVQAIVLAPFFVLGWLLGIVSLVFVRCIAYTSVSVRTGWRVARKEPLDQPRLDDVLTENARLRAELERQASFGYATRSVPEG